MKKIAAVLFILFLAGVSKAEVEPVDEEKEHLTREEVKKIKKLQRERDPDRHLEKRKPHVRRLLNPKKLKHVETGLCLDFMDGDNRGRLVGCDWAGTRVAKVRSGGVTNFKFVAGNQNGKCLDAMMEGAWECDGSDEQDWDYLALGGGEYRLRDNLYQKYLDDSDTNPNKIEMAPNNPTCSCQKWKLTNQ